MTRPVFVVPAGYVVLRRGAEVLLQMRQNTGYVDGLWACGAAGHIEANESAVDTLARSSDHRGAVQGKRASVARPG